MLNFSKVATYFANKAVALERAINLCFAESQICRTEEILIICDITTQHINLDINSIHSNIPPDIRITSEKAPPARLLSLIL